MCMDTHSITSYLGKPAEMRCRLFVMYKETFQKAYICQASKMLPLGRFGSYLHKESIRVFKNKMLEYLTSDLTQETHYQSFHLDIHSLIVNTYNFNKVLHFAGDTKEESFQSSNSLRGKQIFYCFMWHKNHSYCYCEWVQTC